MKNSLLNKTLALFFIFFLIIILSVVLIKADILNRTINLEIDLIGFNETIIDDEISIDTFAFIDMGNITQSNPKTDNIKVYVNNTGNVDITVTPMLKNDSDPIFTNLYFKRILADPYSILGNFSLDIDKPLTSDYRSKYFYMKLDLTNIIYPFETDMIDYRGELQIVAMSR